MKNILVLLVIFASMFIAFTEPIEAQTNAFTGYSDVNITNDDGEVVGKHISTTFTMDSLGTVLLSKVIDLNDFVGTDFETYPATFRFKTVSTYDSSNTRIRLLACYRDAVDTVFAIDTLRTWGLSGVTATQIETDSTGELTFNRKIAPQIRIAIECLRSDVNTGYLDIVFRKQE